MSDTTTPRAHHPAKCPKCAHPVLIYSDATTLILSVRQQRSATTRRAAWTGTCVSVPRHAQAYRPQLWLGVNNRGPMTASGIYQVIVRRGLQCGVEVFPHRFRHHFSHTWLDHGGAEGDLMELNGWTSPQTLRATAPAPAAPEPAAATTASWTTPRNPRPPALSLQGCLHRPSRAGKISAGYLAWQPADHGLAETDGELVDLLAYRSPANVRTCRIADVAYPHAYAMARKPLRPEVPFALCRRQACSRAERAGTQRPWAPGTHWLRPGWSLIRTCDRQGMHAGGLSSREPVFAVRISLTGRGERLNGQQ